MKNPPMKEPHKEHFFDLIKGSAQPLSGARFLANPKNAAPPPSAAYGGKQLHSRPFGGGASGRHGGKSR